MSLKGATDGLAWPGGGLKQESSSSTRQRRSLYLKVSERGVGGVVVAPDPMEAGLVNM